MTNTVTVTRKNLKKCMRIGKINKNTKIHELWYITIPSLGKELSRILVDSAKVNGSTEMWTVRFEMGSQMVT